MHALTARLGYKPWLRPEDQGDRYVYANNPSANDGFCDNVVITSRYTWYNFLPVFLLQQFTRFANAYFLLVAILQTIPAITITNGVPTNFLPLSIVLLFDGLVTAREDYKRHVDDAKANQSEALVMRNGVFSPIMWKHVCVGDILKIKRGESVPADCVFLSSYSEDLNQPDTCYVQTAQLDGETNLKLRQAIPPTVRRFRSDADCATFGGVIRCEAPNPAFDKFVGTICMDSGTAAAAAAGSRGGAAGAPSTFPLVSSLNTPDGGADLGGGRGGGGVRSVVNPLSAAASRSNSRESDVEPMHVHNTPPVPVPLSLGGVPAAAVVFSPQQQQHQLSNGTNSLLLGGIPRVSAAAAAAPAHDSLGTAGGKPLPLESDQTLLRGSVMRNVDYVYAIAVYTGRETKVRVKQRSTVSKRAQVETEINRMIIILLVLLIVFCLTGGIGGTAWTDRWHTAAYYLHERKYAGGDAVRQIFTYFLLNAGFIPVSLYVTVRLSRSFQMWFMEQDIAMFHSEPIAPTQKPSSSAPPPSSSTAVAPAAAAATAASPPPPPPHHSVSFGAQLLALLGWDPPGKSPSPSEKPQQLTHDFPFRVRCMDLNDELGQITQVFSDKTGTLTLNYMEFRKLLVGEVAYGVGATQIGVDRLKREGADTSHAMAQLEAEKRRGRAPDALPHVNFEDGSDSHPHRSIGKDAAAPADGGQGTAIYEFMLNMALNHTVLPERERDANGVVTGTRLSASSPDEEAFLFAAETFGYKFVGRTSDSVTLKCRMPLDRLPLLGQGYASGSTQISGSSPPSSAPASPPASARAPQPHYVVPAPHQAPALAHPQYSIALVSHAATATAATAVSSAVVGGGGGGCELTFRILHILAYSQDRKRMSVIVELPSVRSAPSLAGGSPDAATAPPSGGGEVVLFCKGADSVLLPRCRAPVDSLELRARKVTRRTLAEWGNDGLRTLVFAQRKLSASEFAAWSAAFVRASSDIEEIRKRKAKAPNAIDALMDSIETDMLLQGATANEDKLQPEVPETIAQLSRAGIKVWMVTGDKQETAVNIGFATRLLDETMRQVVATSESAGGIGPAIKRIRVAAKRMRHERKRDAEHAAAQLSSVEASIAWVTKQLEALEARMGFSVPRTDDAELAIEAAKLQQQQQQAADAAEAAARLSASAAPADATASLSSQSTDMTRHFPRIMSFAKRQSSAPAVTATSTGEQQQQQQRGGSSSLHASGSSSSTAVTSVSVDSGTTMNPYAMPISSASSISSLAPGIYRPPSAPLVRVEQQQQRLPPPRPVLSSTWSLRFGSLVNARPQSSSPDPSMGAGAPRGSRAVPSISRGAPAAPRAAQQQTRPASTAPGVAAIGALTTAIGSSATVAEAAAADFPSAADGAGTSTSPVPVELIRSRGYSFESDADEADIAADDGLVVPVQLQQQQKQPSSADPPPSLDHHSAAVYELDGDHDGGAAVPNGYDSVSGYARDAAPNGYVFAAADDSSALLPSGHSLNTRESHGGGDAVDSGAAARRSGARDVYSSEFATSLDRVAQRGDGGGEGARGEDAAAAAASIVSGRFAPHDDSTQLTARVASMQQQQQLGRPNTTTTTCTRPSRGFAATLDDGNGSSDAHAAPTSDDALRGPQLQQQQQHQHVSVSVGGLPLRAHPLPRTLALSSSNGNSASDSSGSRSIRASSSAAAGGAAAAAAAAEGVGGGTAAFWDVRANRKTVAYASSGGSGGSGGGGTLPALPLGGAHGDADLLAHLASPLLGPHRRPFALVIDEMVLDAALAHPRSRAYLLYVSVHCAAVIACRARPDQKAQVVRLIREGVPSSRTLAIGDGANDVDMIRTAHVGVGIAGVEGVQAANASDYSIGRFRFLQRLLLVHGRWNYNRMAKLVLYSFYKNLVFVVAQFWFSTTTGFSGQKFYIEYGTQTFNLLYTSLPVLMLGIYDQDVDAEWSLRYPALYERGRTASGLNVRIFVSWMVCALCESLVVFFVSLHGYTAPDPLGVTPYVFQLGTVCFSCVVAVVTMRLATEMNSHHAVFSFLTAGSALLWIPAAFIFDALNSDAMRGGVGPVFGSASFWLVLGVVLGITGSRLLAWKAYRRFEAPELRHIVQEVATITHDSTDLDNFCEASDLARRTGKSLADVVNVQRIATVTNDALEARALRWGGAGSGISRAATGPPPELSVPAQDAPARGLRALLRRAFGGKKHIASTDATGGGGALHEREIVVADFASPSVQRALRVLPVSSRVREAGGAPSSTSATPGDAKAALTRPAAAAAAGGASSSRGALGGGTTPSVAGASPLVVVGVPPVIVNVSASASPKSGPAAPPPRQLSQILLIPHIDTDTLERVMITRPRKDADLVNEAYDPAADFDTEENTSPTHPSRAEPVRDYTSGGGGSSSLVFAVHADVGSGGAGAATAATAATTSSVAAGGASTSARDRAVSSIYADAQKAGLRLPRRSRDEQGAEESKDAPRRTRKFSDALSRIATSSPALAILSRHQRSTTANAGTDPAGTGRSGGVPVALAQWGPLPPASRWAAIGGGGQQQQHVSPLLVTGQHASTAAPGPEPQHARVAGTIRRQRSSSFSGEPESPSKRASSDFTGDGSAGYGAHRVGRSLRSPPPRSVELEDVTRGGRGRARRQLDAPLPNRAGVVTTGFSFSVDDKASALVASRYAKWGRENIEAAAAVRNGEPADDCAGAAANAAP